MLLVLVLLFSVTLTGRTHAHLSAREDDGVVMIVGPPSTEAQGQWLKYIPPVTAASSQPATAVAAFAQTE